MIEGNKDIEIMEELGQEEKEWIKLLRSFIVSEQ